MIYMVQFVTTFPSNLSTSGELELIAIQAGIVFAFVLVGMRELERLYIVFLKHK